MKKRIILIAIVLFAFLNISHAQEETKSTRVYHVIKNADGTGGYKYLGLEKDSAKVAEGNFKIIETLATEFNLEHNDHVLGNTLVHMIKWVTDYEIVDHDNGYKYEFTAEYKQIKGIKTKVITLQKKIKV